MFPECCPDKIGMLSTCFQNRVRMLSDYCPHVAGITVRIRPEYASGTIIISSSPRKLPGDKFIHLCQICKKIAANPGGLRSSSPDHLADFLWFRRRTLKQSLLHVSHTQRCNHIQQNFPDKSLSIFSSQTNVHNLLHCGTYFKNLLISISRKFPK